MASAGCQIGQERAARAGTRVASSAGARRYGKFTRSFVLPRDVDADNIRARVDTGVLSISIPKSEKARRRRI